MLYSDHYKKQLEQVHQQRPWGNIGHRFSDHVLEVYKKYDCQSCLDYGCGFGRLRNKIGDQIPITNYDPGKPEWAALPEPHDLVVCTDVMEHVEPEHVDAVLDHIYSLAHKAVFFMINPNPSTGTLPDGRLLHLTVRPLEWWAEKLERRWHLEPLKDDSRLWVCTPI